MKLFSGWLVLLIPIALLPAAGFAQCGTIHTISYDTTVTGSGSADPGYSFSMPKFNASLGTLTSVQIASVVTVQFSYTIENDDTTKLYKTTKVRVARYDEITGPTLSAPITNDFYSNPISSSLRWTDSITGSGPDFQAIPPYYVLNQDTVAKQTFSNTAAYMGTGTVGFTYKTDLGSQINGNPKVSMSGTSSDMVKFIITYTYCDNIILSSSITNFSAAKKDGYIEVRWLTSNEVPNHNYELQKSLDGNNFTPVTTVASTVGVNQIGNYLYNYVPASNEKSKIYFRIKQIRNGVPEYSVVRVVDLGETVQNNSTIKLIPNPSSGAFTISLLNNTEAGDWNIELFNIKGQVISKKLAANTTLSKFPMSETVSAGVYFVMVTNKRTNKKFVERLIVN